MKIVPTSMREIHTHTHTHRQNNTICRRVLLRVLLDLDNVESNGIAGCIRKNDVCIWLLVRRIRIPSFHAFGITMPTCFFSVRIQALNMMRIDNEFKKEKKVFFI